MERMNRSARSGILLAAVGLLVALTTTCQDPTGLIRSVETTVMSVNDKFLRIVSLTPANQSLDVNPGQDMTIQFDRAIDESTITANVSIKRADTGAAFTDWTRQYTDATRTLKLQLSQPFVGSTPYTLTVSRGLRGSDGSQLLEATSCSFTTNDVPSAVFCFGSDPANPLQYANAALGNPVPVKITIQASDPDPAGIGYFLTTNPVDAASPGYGNFKWVSNYLVSDSISLTEGLHTAYLRITDFDQVPVPITIERSIIVDRTAPTVMPGSSRVVAYDQILWTWSASDGGTYPSGVSDYQYSFNSDGPWITTTSISHIYDLGHAVYSSAGDYYFYVKAHDKADNLSGFRSLSVTVDSSPILPEPGKKFSTISSFDWPDYPDADFYLVFAGTKPDSYDMLNGYETRYSVVKDPPLPRPTLEQITFYWRYVAGVGRYSGKYKIIYESPPFKVDYGLK